jgi:hypothetical protein
MTTHAAPYSVRTKHQRTYWFQRDADGRAWRTKNPVAAVPAPTRRTTRTRRLETKDPPAASDDPPTLVFQSPDIAPHQTIATRFACAAAGGAGAEPRFVWGAVPPNARSLVLIVDDPDARDTVFTHLAVVDIAPSARTLAPGVGRRVVAWRPFCPPRGPAHRYRFALFAMRDAALRGSPPPAWTRDAFERAYAAGIESGAVWYASFAAPRE